MQVNGEDSLTPDMRASVVIHNDPVLNDTVGEIYTVYTFDVSTIIVQADKVGGLSYVTFSALSLWNTILQFMYRYNLQKKS